MKLSTKGRYGLTAMHELALHPNVPVAIRTIAEWHQISDAYLEQLFASLRKAGLVTSTRGASGGYVLARSPEEMSIRAILQALEGTTSITECLTEDACGNSCCCVSRPLFTRIQRSIDEVLCTTTLADMVAENLAGEKEEAQ